VALVLLLSVLSRDVSKALEGCHIRRRRYAYFRHGHPISNVCVPRLSLYVFKGTGCTSVSSSSMRYSMLLQHLIFIFLCTQIVQNGKHVQMLGTSFVQGSAQRLSKQQHCICDWTHVWGITQYVACSIKTQHIPSTLSSTFQTALHDVCDPWTQQQLYLHLLPMHCGNLQ